MQHHAPGHGPDAQPRERCGGAQAALVLTRPKAAAEAFCAALRAAGGHFTPVYLPVISTHPIPFEADATGQGDVILSSAAGLSGMKGQARAGAGAWCVGPQTAKAAASCGFEIRDVARTAAHLLDRLKEAKPSAPLLYLRGARISMDLCQELRAAGIAAQERITYHQRPCPWPEGALTSAFERIAANGPRLITVFSAGSAEALCKELASYDCARLTLLAVSKKAAAPLQGKRFAQLSISQTPDRDGMIALCLAHQKRRAIRP